METLTCKLYINVKTHISSGWFPGINQH